MKIKGFSLMNQEKVVRAAEGTPTARGELSGGVGYDDQDLLLAAYDKLGGLITEDGNRIKTGSFYDFKGDKPWEKPKVVYLVRVDGQEVEVPKGKELPMEAQARKIAGAKKVAPKKVVAAKAPKKVAAKRTAKEVEE